MNEKIYVDWGKLVQVTLLFAVTTILGLAQVISSETVTLVLGTGAGYIFGNGKSVKEGSPPAPLIGRRPADGQTWHLGENDDPGPLD